MYGVNPKLSVPPTRASPFGIHTFVLYVCVSISALQTRSPLSFFSRSRIYALTHEICFSDLLLCVTLSRL